MSAIKLKVTIFLAFLHGTIILLCQWKINQKVECGEPVIRWVQVFFTLFPGFGIYRVMVISVSKCVK